MKTDLKPGSVFVVRENGGYRDWCVTDDGAHYTGIGRRLQPGETVYFAVWKGDRLESRKSYTLKPGDVSWESSGILTEKHRDNSRVTPEMMNSMMAAIGDLMAGKSVRLPNPPKQTALPVTEENFIFQNVYGGRCPAWLKGVR